MRVAAVLLAAQLLISCASSWFHHERNNTRPYLIANANTPEDRQRVQTVLASVAGRLEYSPARPPGNIPGMLAFYRSTASDEFVSFLGAHTQGDGVIAAVEAPFGPKLKSLERADRQLFHELKKAFRGRVSKLKKWDQSFVNRSKPKTPSKPPAKNAH